MNKMPLQGVLREEKVGLPLGTDRQGARPVGKIAMSHLKGQVVAAGHLLLSPSARSSLVGVELLS